MQGRCYRKLCTHLLCPYTAFNRPHQIPATRHSKHTTIEVQQHQHHTGASHAAGASSSLITFCPPDGSPDHLIGRSTSTMGQRSGAINPCNLTHVLTTRAQCQCQPWPVKGQHGLAHCRCPLPDGMTSGEEPLSIFQHMSTTAAIVSHAPQQILSVPMMVDEPQKSCQHPSRHMRELPP